MPRQQICHWEQVPLIFDIPIAALLLGRSCENVKKMCQRREIPAFKVGREWRFDKTVFVRWINERQAGNAPQSKEVKP